MFDAIIIGAGPAGLSAAIYARRFSMKTLVIGQLFGGLLTTTNNVENWPGIKKISGVELMKQVESHARSVGAELINDHVNNIKKIKNGFSVKASKTYHAKSIIIATGTIKRRLGVEGEGEYYAKGVSYCATCDAPFYKNKIVGVVGGSDSAVKESILLSSFAKKVFIIYRRNKLRAEPILLNKLKTKSNIKTIFNTNVTKINGDGNHLTSVVFDNGKKFNLDGLFIEIGSIPQNSLAKQLGVKLNKRGELIVDKNGKTSVKGVFAAGDCTDTIYKQAITGAAMGVIAAFSAHEFINSK